MYCVHLHTFNMLLFYLMIIFVIGGGGGGDGGDSDVLPEHATCEHTFQAKIIARIHSFASSLIHSHIRSHPSVIRFFIRYCMCDDDDDIVAVMMTIHTSTCTHRVCGGRAENEMNPRAYFEQ